MEEDQTLKAAHRAMWEQGEYPELARDVLTPLGAALVEACGVSAGMRVLDIAAGAGNAAIAAAAAGADVVASDLSPRMLEAGRREAAARGVELDWVEADAEALPFRDGEFDAVLSCIGVMFAPDHRRAADEMLRVCRPGGTIGLLNWTAEGSIAEFFKVLGPYLPPPPPGSTPPIRWGETDYVRSLLGDRVEDLEVSPGRLEVTHFEDPMAYREYYKSKFGPTIAAYANVADDPDRSAALDRDFLDYARRTNRAASGEPASYGYEYLIFTSRRSAER